MGKVKRQKVNKHKNVNNVVGPLEPDKKARDDILQTLIDQLQDPNLEEKVSALQTISSFFMEQIGAKYFLELNIIKIIAPLLLDKENSVRNAAAGCLKNFSAENSVVCESLVEQDIMTSLICYFHEYGEIYISNENNMTINEYTDTFLKCTNILLNICHNCEVAIKYVENSRIIDILLKCLNLSSHHSDVVMVVLQTLMVITEDNKITAEMVKMKSEEVLLQMINLESSDIDTICIKVFAVGVIFNIFQDDVGKSSANLVNQKICVLSSVLSIDHQILCDKITSNMPLIPEVNHEGPINKEAKAWLKQIFQILEAKKSAIEILTNICSFEDNEELIDESEPSDIEDESNDNYLNHEVLIHSEDKLLPEIFEAIAGTGIFEKVWNQATLPSVCVLLSIKEISKDVIPKLKNLQVTALFCVNNMLLSLPINCFGGLNGVYKIWIETGKLVFKQSSNNLDVIESATCVMRSALDKMKSEENTNTENKSFFSDLSLTDIKLMLNGIEECEMSEVRSNLIRMVGILALLLIDNTNDTVCSVVCSIAEFILDHAKKEDDIIVLAEALDTLVDMFAEDETDTLAKKINLVDKLADLVPVFKSKARNQKRLPTKYKVLVQTVASNLPRFIKYKKKRIASTV